MAFETLKSVRSGNRSTSPAVRISRDHIYLNKFLHSIIKARNVEIQVDKKASQIRLIFKEKESSSTRRVNKMPSAGVIAFKRCYGASRIEGSCYNWRTTRRESVDRHIQSRKGKAESCHESHFQIKENI